MSQQLQPGKFSSTSKIGASKDEFARHGNKLAQRASNQSPRSDLNQPRHVVLSPSTTSSSQISSQPPSSAMERIKERMNAIRAEADRAVERAEAAEAKNKKYEQEILMKDQDIGSLQHRLGVVEGDLDKAEQALNDLKHKSDEGAEGKTTNDTLTRKIQLLEEELDAAEKNAKETVEKLRQVDVKAEHFERQVLRLEQERDLWEKKYEDAQEKYRNSQKELDELVRSMEGL